METKEVRELIGMFFGKRFSKKTQMAFRYWFRLSKDHEAKDAAMRDIWQKCPSEITSETWYDLSEMQKRMAPWRGRVMRRSPIYRWGKYAAVVAIIVATAAITRLSTPPEVKIVSPEMVEFFVPYGDCRAVKLADGSTVWVNAGSVLVYPKEFIANNRTVYLSGEARFEVAKNLDKPFIVNTHQLDIEALGTVFSVEAYPNGHTTTATLESGSVGVTAKSTNLPVSILKPNEQLVYAHQTKTVNIRTVDATRMAMWRDGYLIFEDSSFEQLITALERKHNVTINYNADKYTGRSYFVKFNPDESLEDALGVLSSLVDNFRYKIIGRTVVIN